MWLKWMSVGLNLESFKVIRINFPFKTWTDHRQNTKTSDNFFLLSTKKKLWFEVFFQCDYAVTKKINYWWFSTSSRFSIFETIN